MKSRKAEEAEGVAGSGGEDASDAAVAPKEKTTPKRATGGEKGRRRGIDAAAVQLRAETEEAARVEEKAANDDAKTKLSLGAAVLGRINKFISPPVTGSEDDEDDDDDDDESQFDYDQKDTMLELYVSSYASQHQLLQCRRNTLVSDENKTAAKEMIKLLISVDERLQKKSVCIGAEEWTSAKVGAITLEDDDDVENGPSGGTEKKKKRAGRGDPSAVKQPKRALKRSIESMKNNAQRFVTVGASIIEKGAFKQRSLDGEEADVGGPSDDEFDEALETIKEYLEAKRKKMRISDASNYDQGSVFFAAVGPASGAFDNNLFSINMDRQVEKVLSTVILASFTDAEPHNSAPKAKSHSREVTRT